MFLGVALLCPLAMVVNLGSIVVVEGLSKGGNSQVESGTGESRAAFARPSKHATLDFSHPAVERLLGVREWRRDWSELETTSVSSPETDEGAGTPPPFFHGLPGRLSGGVGKTWLDERVVEPV